MHSVSYNTDWCQHCIIELRHSANAETVNRICSLQLSMQCSLALFFCWKRRYIVLPVAEKSCRCFHISFRSKTRLLGKTSLTNAVANTIANNPAFALPEYISMDIHGLDWAYIVFCSVNVIEVICWFTNWETEWNKQLHKHFGVPCCSYCADGQPMSMDIM